MKSKHNYKFKKKSRKILVLKKLNKNLKKQKPDQKSLDKELIKMKKL